MSLHRKKVTVRINSQTLHHLHTIALQAGYGDDIGRAIDKIMRMWCEINKGMKG